MKASVATTEALASQRSSRGDDEVKRNGAEGGNCHAIKVSALPSSSSTRISGLIAYIQLTTPRLPASAVSTAIITLSNLLQLKFFSIKLKIKS